MTTPHHHQERVLSKIAKPHLSLTEVDLVCIAWKRFSRIGLFGGGRLEVERRPRDLPKGRKQNLEGGDDLVCDDQGDHGDHGDQGDHDRRI